MDPILDAIRRLASAATFDELTALMRSMARRLIGSDGVTFVLRAGENCYYADEDAITPLWKGRRFPLNSCISGWVMRHGQIALIRDIYADARIPHEAYRATFVRSLAMVPVIQSAPIAAIGAYWAALHEATWSEQHTLQSLANACGIALTRMGPVAYEPYAQRAAS